MTETNSGHRILKNAALLSIGDVGTRALTAVATIFVARYLGVEDFGAIGVGIALASIAGYFTDIGLTHTIIREATKPGADLPRLLGSGFRLRLFLAFLTTLVCSFLFSFIYSSTRLQGVIFAVVLPTIWGGALQGVGVVYFQIVQEMQYIALVRVVAGVATAVALVLGILLHWSVQPIALAYGLASLTAGVLSTTLALRNVPLTGGWSRELLSGLGAFTLSGIFAMALPQLGPLILERVTNLEQVGYFAAAYRIPSLLYTLPGTVATAFYPQLFHYGARDLDKHFALSVRELKLMSLLGVAVTFPFIFYSYWVIEILFGTSWAVSAGPALSLLAGVAIFHSINYPLADSLTTQGLQPKRTAVLGAGLLLGTALYIVLGARWGVLGGAGAAVGVELWLLSGFCRANPRGGQLIKSGLMKTLGILVAIVVGGGTLRLIVGASWFGFMLTFLWSAACVLVLDEETRRFLLRLARSIASRSAVPAKVEP